MCILNQNGFLGSHQLINVCYRYPTIAYSQTRLQCRQFMWESLLDFPSANSWVEQKTASVEFPYCCGNWSQTKPIRCYNAKWILWIFTFRLFGYTHAVQWHTPKNSVGIKVYITLEHVYAYSVIPFSCIQILMYLLMLQILTVWRIK